MDTFETLLTYAKKKLNFLRKYLFYHKDKVNSSALHHMSYVRSCL